jgi:leader peptidase (prepilin peptidase)/N-methyltransferase
VLGPWLARVGARLAARDDAARPATAALVWTAGAGVVPAAVVWGVLLAGVFLGLLTSAAVSIVLLAGRRAGWRTALPFGPPLLVGTVLALALGAGSIG